MPLLDAIVLSRRRRLLIGPGCVLLIGFMAADEASGNSPDFAVACQMARDATNDSALDAPLCLSGGWDKRYPQNGGAKDQRLHGSSPKKSVAATIRVAAIGSGEGLMSVCCIFSR